jgi:hypothetical protein
VVCYVVWGVFAGILHFLELVMHCRKIFKRRTSECGGYGARGLRRFGWGFARRYCVGSHCLLLGLTQADVGSYGIHHPSSFSDVCFLIYCFPFFLDSTCADEDT